MPTKGSPAPLKIDMMMEKAPHQLIEGMIISAFAVGSKKSYIYVRGEYDFPIECLRIAGCARKLMPQAFWGKNILGSGFDHDLDVYRGAGAYICGEETGMISSLEGQKGATQVEASVSSGYRVTLRKPTIVNNVETLAAVKYIIRDGAAAYRKHGTEKSTGTVSFFH
jgi:NADH-quinone oxidoreductase subunit F